MILLPLHILAGLLALTAGAVAFAAAKGGRLHRGSGRVFVGAMLFMSASGSVMAAASSKSGTDISVVVGVLTFYLVATGFLTVRRSVAQSRDLLRALATLAGLAAGAAFVLGALALSSARGAYDGVPAAAYFVFGAIALAAALGDLRLLRAGAIEGAPRLARHLWRMGIALFFASFSFFIGQAKLFPEPLRHLPLLAVPVLLVLLLTAGWFVRLRWRQRRLVPQPR